MENEQKFLEAIVNIGNRYKELAFPVKECLNKIIELEKKLDKALELLSTQQVKVVPAVISAPVIKEEKEKEKEPEVKIDLAAIKKKKLEQQLEEKIKEKEEDQKETKEPKTNVVKEEFDDFDNMPKAIVKGFPVQQTIRKKVGASAKPLHMANVLIFKNGQEIYKTKTKPNGIWQAVLEPGEYIVKISKKEPDGEYISEQSLSMPASNISLDMAIISTASTK
jgi:recombination DNA repair RAD52 pathway protein